MLGKFDCGCIGTKPDENGEYILLSSCAGADVTPNPIFAPHRNTNQHNKRTRTWLPLDLDAESKVLDEINKLVFDGHRLREIRSLLKE